MRRALLAAWPALAVARPALAQPVSPIAAAFAGWMQRHGVASGAAALAIDGRLVLVQGFGGQDATRPVPVWSLSKYVTGLAVARLVAQRRLTMEMTLAEAAPALFPPGAALAPVTVGQLLSHRSGLPAGTTEGLVPALRARLRQGATGAALAEVLRRLRPLRPPGEAYAYANDNFLLAGLVAQEAAGESYGAFLDREILAGTGVRPRRLDPRQGVLAAAAGLALSGPEYLALLVRGLGRSRLVAPGVRRWMENPAGKSVAPGSPVFYSLGLMHQPGAGGLTHWHHGNWRWRNAAGEEEGSGAFAAMAADGSAWFVAFRPDPGDEARGELNRLLWEGRRQESAAGRADRFAAFVSALPQG